MSCQSWPLQLLHLRFHRDTSQELAVKLILNLNFFVLYSTHHKGKTFPREHVVLSKSGKKVA